MRCILALAILWAQHPLAAGEGPCYGGDNCCTAASPCNAGEGDCDTDAHCSGDLICGEDNCDRKAYQSFDATDDCCHRDPDSCPTVCTKEYKPVCCSNGKTYPNMCEYEKAACLSYGSELSLLHEGPCCDTEKECGDKYEPVCCTDGKTYDNMCEYEKAACLSYGISIAYKGECKSGDCGEPSCEQTCGKGEICEPTDYKCVQEPCCLAHRCVEECPESCPDYDDPICGSDGKTYFCHCNLRMANCGLTKKITKVHNGACEGYVYPANISVPLVKRCNGGDSCCAADEVCGLGEGDCDRDADCGEGLICGRDNCQGTGFDITDDCCMLPDGAMDLPKQAERVIYTLPGKDPLSAFGLWPTQAVMIDNIAYFSGVIGIDGTTGKMVEGVRLQARQLFENLEATMKLMDIDMTRGLKATVYLTDIDNREVLLKVWLEECNWKEYPALSVVEVSKLPRDALFQIDLVAMCGMCETKFYTIGQK